jgi:hypothetical protein
VQDWIAQMRELISRTNNPKDKKQTVKISKEDTEALQETSEYIETLRDILGAAPGEPDYSKLDDDAFLKLVWNEFEAGNLLPIYHRYPGVAEPGPPDKPSDGPTPPKPSGGPDDPDDPSDDPFIPGVCLLRAASEGAPFVTIPEPGGPGESN